LSNANIAEIVELYGDVTKNGRSKLFDNSDFGYRQVTVERPLRLAFQVTPERIAVLKEEGAFQKLATSKKKGKDGQREVHKNSTALSAISGSFIAQISSSVIGG
jgi:type I restriction enzyme M protein